jgi:Rad3-related DNA helicase
MVRAAALWREHAYRVAVDVRADTRYARRAESFALTAATVAAFSAGLGEPIAFFFPSYRYAEAIRTYLEASEPGLRVAMQPRGFDLAEQGQWVAEALLLSDALFFVLGGGFAEGIDLLGGRVHRAMVVGPALPEVNALQNARRAEVEAIDPRGAFRRVYQEPGLRKVNQALGRLVRAPGQRAAVLLHGRRFAEASYRALLAPEYREGTLVRGADELAAWIATLTAQER